MSVTQPRFTAPREGEVGERSDPGAGQAAAADRPILIVPYMWIGDFVRCHSVVKLLKARWPERPVDMLTTRLCAPLLDYLPGVRRGIPWDLPRKRLALRQHRALAERLRVERYGMALIMPRTWKSALAPFLAGIPQRVGFFGELRLGLLNDIRWGERALPRMVDRCASLALAAGAALPSRWPAPELVVPAVELADWRRNAAPGPAVALAPGAVGPSKRWPIASFAALARRLAEQGCSISVVGGPDEKPLAAEIVAAAGTKVRDLTGPDLRNAILALAAANVAVSNDSGLLHVAAALGTPTVGIFGPTSPWHWAPLNPLAATIETRTEVECRPCHKPTCRVRHHRCMRDIEPEQVLEAARRALAPV
jgi:heptosyltransferase-2